MDRVDFAELDVMTGELLPARTLMSTVQVFYSCQTVSSAGTSGLLGTGLFAQPAYTSTSCMPAVVSTD